MLSNVTIDCVQTLDLSNAFSSASISGIAFKFRQLLMTQKNKETMQILRNGHKTRANICSH